MLSYSPYEVYRCCQHNVSHGWPYYAEELWLATADGGLCASLYAASEVQAKVGDGTAVKIVEATDYPFEDTIRLKISLAKPVRFPLYLRIPHWSGTPVLTLNGRRINAKAEPLSYLVVERQWSNGDTVSLRLPMHTAVRTWQKNHDAVSVGYGPLWFSLRIGERWRRYGRGGAWPEWEVLSGDALELWAAAGQAESGRIVGVGASPGTAGPAAVHGRDGASRVAGEGQADSRLAPGPLGADRTVAAKSGQIGPAGRAGNADSHGRGPAPDRGLSDDWRRSRRPRVGAAGKMMQFSGE